MLGLTPDDKEDEYTHNEFLKTWMELHDSDEGRIFVSSQQHGTLRNIKNNDLITQRFKILSSVQNCSDMNKWRSL